MTTAHAMIAVEETLAAMGRGPFAVLPWLRGADAPDALSERLRRSRPF